MSYTKEFLEPIIINSLTWSEVCRKIGRSVCGSNHKLLQRLSSEYGISYSHFLGLKAASIYKILPEHVLTKDSEFARTTAKEIIIRYSLIPYRCSICELLPEWCGKELILILDHINGDGKDHRLENLRFLCPNCNEQQPTNKGRNTKGHKKAFHHKRRIKDKHITLRS